MRREFLMLSLSCLLAVVAGCDKDAASQLFANKQPSVDVCALLTKEEIQAVQGSPLKDTQSSEHMDKGIRTSHCFYVTENSRKSVSLLLTQKAPDYVKGHEGPKEAWANMFNRESDEEKEGKRRIKVKNLATERKTRGHRQRRSGTWATMPIGSAPGWPARSMS